VVVGGSEIWQEVVEIASNYNLERKNG